MIQHESILLTLAAAPDILVDFIAEIPEEGHKVNRIPSKWSIHEHACHLAVAQEMINERFHLFKSTKNPEFKRYQPGDTIADNDLKHLVLQECLDDFVRYRMELVNLLEDYTEKDWKNKATHREYKIFTPHIFMRHVMLHDQLHMYRIEELWLTRDEFLPK